MNCIHVVGTHTQLFQLAFLHQAIAEVSALKQKIVCFGHQYTKIRSDPFFEKFDLPSPHYEPLTNDLSQPAQIDKLTTILAHEKHSAVIVYGDTGTSAAGALAAKKHDFPIAHVEAGIRTGDNSLPEERNRHMADRLADIHFCSTTLCKKNLQREGMAGRTTAVTGDIMLDAWKYAWKRIYDRVPLEKIPTHHYVLVTIDREENTASPEKLAAIVTALNEIHPTIPVIMLCHPAIRKKIKALGIKVLFRLELPCSYLQMVRLLDHAAFVITDSKGLCREAFFSGKPSLIVMEYPFWPEIIEQGQCIQTSATREEILANFAALQKAPISYDETIFGHGNAAEQMAAILAKEWSK